MNSPGGIGNLVAVLLITLPAYTSGQALQPEQTVRGNVVTSVRGPKVEIHLPTTAQYVGADRWILFGITDCELHAFVEADEQRNVQRLYWVQFESYLPTKPELHYEYDSPRHTDIGGMDFYVDTGVSSADKKVKPGSDSEHIRALIESKGYKRSAANMNVRLVHLFDEAKRKELMIIYAEDLAPTGFSAADLKKGGKAYDEWTKIEKGLIERAKEKILIGVFGGNDDTQNPGMPP